MGHIKLGLILLKKEFQIMASRFKTEYKNVNISLLCYFLKGR